MAILRIKISDELAEELKTAASVCGETLAGFLTPTLIALTQPVREYKNRCIHERTAHAREEVHELERMYALQSKKTKKIRLL